MSRIICVDAGHGGKDSGAVGNGLYEKNLTLDIASEVKKSLENCGFKVIMTRQKDTYIELSKRCAVANNGGADIFISIHINSAADTAANGAETLCYTKNDLADKIQKYMTDVFLFKNRGVKERKDLYVLNGTKMTAVLAEVGFISNTENVAKMKQADFAKKAAECIARAVCDYYKTEFKADNAVNGGENMVISKKISAERVIRKYKYNAREAAFEVLNADNKNYVSVRDIAELLGKNTAYDAESKLTQLYDR